MLHFAGGGVGVGGTERGADGDGYREFDFLDQVSIGAFKKKKKRGLKFKKRDQHYRLDNQNSTTMYSI